MALQPAKDIELATGYRLVERLGAGGYGEVWKATAPGGLAKAVKIVYGGTEGPQAEQELKALSRIKEVRHPFLLSLERIDVLDGQLIVVTELADGSLYDRFLLCRKAGLRGVPRDELLAHLRDAADALDYMARTHGLQHLDVKPQNLLLVGGRMKVADFGQVRRLGGTGTTVPGVTPFYAPPEAFDGRVSPHSDQYSLAVVYHEMLSGVRPFPGSTLMQLAAQHIGAAPRLTPVPACDRPAIARALSKLPDQRFPSCLAMVGALPAGAVELPVEVPPLPLEDQTPTRPALDEEGTPPDVPAPSEGDFVFDPGELRETAPPAADAAPAPRPPTGADADPGGLRETVLPAELPPPAPESADDDPRDVLRDTVLAGAVAATAGPPRERYIPLPGAEPGLRPTLFLGVGGLAGAALRRLRKRLRERDGQLAPHPLHSFLLLDTDREDLRRVRQDDRAGALEATDTLAVPLHPPEHYRPDAKRFLRWLDRRWLYNIPRSLRTEGVRPLGRLALVDNAAEVLAALREALGGVSCAAALAAARAAGATVRDETPRVFLVASITGGTGGGMVVSLAYAVRQVLAELGLSGGPCALLLHATGPKEEDRELARVNTSATLRELDLLGRSVAAYPGDTDAGLSPFRPGVAPFDDAYLVPLGDRLERVAAESATEAVADYLCLDADPAGGACLDKLRLRWRASPTLLRTFGVARVGGRGAERPLAPAARLLCRQLTEQWVADPRPDVVQELHRQLHREAAALGLEERTLPLVLQADVNAAAGGHPHAFIPQLLARAAAEAGSPRPVAMLGPVDAAFAPEVERPGGTAPPTRTLYTAVRESAERRGTEIGRALVNWLVNVVEQPGQRFRAAERAASLLTKTIAALIKTARARSARNRGQRQALRRHIQTSGSQSGVRRVADSTPGARGGRDVEEYCRLWLRETADENAVTLLAAVQRQVDAFQEDVSLCCRQLKVLAEGFGPAPGARAWPTPRGGVPGRGPGAPAPATDDALPPGLVEEFDRSIRGGALEKAGGLWGILTGPADPFRNASDVSRPTPERFAEDLLARAPALIRKVVRELNTARLFLQKHGGPEGALPVLLARAQAARPRLSAAASGQQLVVALPEGPSGDTLNELLAGALPGTPGALVRSDDDVMLCYETAGCPLAAVSRSLIGAPDVPDDLVRSVMTPLGTARAAPTVADLSATPIR